MTTQLHLTGPLGQQISVTCTDYPDTLQQQRQWGARGFTSGEVPTGGYQLPYCMADTFDWSLIGARKWTNPEGEEVILHRGRSYKRRELPANEKKNMPAAIKYSRGAKNSDPEHLKEGDDGGFQYVTLAVFKGNGKSIPDYEVSQQQRGQADQTALQPQQPAPIGEKWGAELEGIMRGLLSETRFAGRDPVKLAAHIVKREIGNLGELTAEESKRVKAVCEAERDKAAAA